jgi:lysophospholipase L1-like esterase
MCSKSAGNGHSTGAARKRFSLLALGLLMPLVLAELALRARHGSSNQNRERREASTGTSPYQPSGDPVLLYEPRPGLRREGALVVESHGIWRQAEVPEAKEAGETRIVALGDSITAWQGGFPEQLEALLRGAGTNRQVRVLNFGVDGYNTLQEARVLATKAMAFDPDLILLQYCMNDVGVSITPSTWYLPPPRSLLFDAVARRLRWGRHRRAVPFKGPERDPAYWQAMYAADSEGWQGVLTGLREIRQSAAARSIPVCFILFPFLNDHAWHRPAADRYLRQVAEAAAAEGFHVLDVQDLYESHGLAPPDIKMSAPDIYHPDLRGHRLVAEELKRLLPGLLP